MALSYSFFSLHAKAAENARSRVMAAEIDGFGAIGNGLVVEFDAQPVAAAGDKFESRLRLDDAECIARQGRFGISPNRGDDTMRSGPVGC